MVARIPKLFLLMTLTLAASSPALACDGFVEAPVSCEDSSPIGFAQWMLKRATSAIAADKDRALGQFTRGEGGFRTADSYVFCVGPDGVMSAHPNPILRGHDVRDLHDRTGHYFIKDMLQQAKIGEISVARYLFPKLGSTVEEPKTTYYTRAGDQVCGVGVYDADAGHSAAASTPEEQFADLRRKLDAEIPASSRADWIAFLAALAARDDARDVALAKARDGLQAVQAALTLTVQERK